MVWRELLLCLSRVIMLVFILTIHDFQGPAFKTIMIFSFACALTIPYFSKKSLERVEKRNVVDAGVKIFDR
jgi:hypothetical protein